MDEGEVPRRCMSLDDEGGVRHVNTVPSGTACTGGKFQSRTKEQ